MTMGLVRGLTTTQSYRKKKNRKKSQKLLKMEQEHEQYLKKLGVGKTQLPKDAKGRRKGIYQIPNYRENCSSAELSNTVAANGAAKEKNVYTGTEIMGIVTTHKSNLMPIRRDNKTAARDAATMRRN